MQNRGESLLSHDGNTRSPEFQSDHCKPPKTGGDCQPFAPRRTSGGRVNRFHSAAGTTPQELMKQTILVHVLCLTCFFVVQDAQAQFRSDNQQWTEVQLAAPVTS